MQPLIHTDTQTRVMSDSPAFELNYLLGNFRLDRDVPYFAGGVEAGRKLLLFFVVV